MASQKAVISISVSRSFRIGSLTRDIESLSKPRFEVFKQQAVGFFMCACSSSVSGLVLLLFSVARRWLRCWTRLCDARRIYRRDAAPRCSGLAGLGVGHFHLGRRIDRDRELRRAGHHHVSRNRSYRGTDERRDVASAGAQQNLPSGRGQIAAGPSGPTATPSGCRSSRR